MQPYSQFSGRQLEFPIRNCRALGRGREIMRASSHALRPGMVIQHEGQLFTIQRRSSHSETSAAHANAHEKSQRAAP